MTIVERALTIPTWAKRITVQLNGETLVIQGEDRIATPVPSKELPADQDFLRQYTAFSKLWSGSEKRSGKRPPHIQFANSKSDDELIAFVGRFGPVQANKLWWLPNQTVTAYQDMPGLRRDRLIFSGATKLAVARGCGGVDAADPLADGLGDILRGVCQPGPATEIRHIPTFDERPWYGRHQILPFFISLFRQEDFDAETNSLSPNTPAHEAFRSISPKKLRNIGQIALSILLNCFPPQLTAVGDRMMELPVYDKGAILPVLYFMLRQDCLREQSVAICARPVCGAFFAVERSDQRYCSEKCSRLQRQRDYWQHRGKDLRARRVSRERNKKGRQKRGTV